MDCARVQSHMSMQQINSDSVQLYEEVTSELLYETWKSLRQYHPGDYFLSRRNLAMVVLVRALLKFSLCSFRFPDNTRTLSP